jgi:hypothetical protein
MRRRTLLQWIVATMPALPVARVRLAAQTRELTPEAVAMLHAIGPTVLPASLGAPAVKAAVDRFVEWTRGYREGVPTSHGYGDPVLTRTKASPVPDYVAQLASLDAAAKRKGGAFQALDLETRRAVLDEALTAAGVRNIPGRPSGQHVVSDLMASWFRSSAANDQVYRAAILRQTCRPMQMTTRRPEPLKG